VAHEILSSCEGVGGECKSPRDFGNKVSKTLRGLAIVGEKVIYYR